MKERGKRAFEKERGRETEKRQGREGNWVENTKRKGSIVRQKIEGKGEAKRG